LRERGLELVDLGGEVLKTAGVVDGQVDVIFLRRVASTPMSDLSR